jgi:hypothetical protein
MSVSDSVSYSESIKLPLSHDDAMSLHRSRDGHPKRTKPLPVRWQPPSHIIPRLIFRTMCFCLTFHTDLDFMWDIFKDPKGWENFHIQYLVQLNQLSTVVRRCDSSAALSPLLIGFDSKDWSLRLSQSLSPLPRP